MQALRKIPWWVALLFSGGIGGMSTFAGSVLTPAIQAAGFAISAVLFIFAVVAACWHFGLRWRNGPALYVSHIRQRLPAEGPQRPFNIYQLLDTEPPQIAPGIIDCSGPIDWHGERPWCERVEVTNHGDETLVNVRVNILLETSPSAPGQPPLAPNHEMGVEFEQVRAGETATAFIVSAARLTITGKPISAFGTRVGGKPRQLRFHTKTLGMMVFYPPALMQLINPQKAVDDRHKQILKSLAPLLATVQEQALTYGQRDLTKMASAKMQVEELISEIPYDEGTAQTVRDFLQACAIAAEKHNTADEMREARDDVSRIAPSLFQQLHQGVRIDRSKIDLPDWCREDSGRTQSSPFDLLPEQPSNDELIAAGRSAVEKQLERLKAKQESARRVLIANGRDLVQRYRDNGMQEPFVAFLAKQRSYLDIQPHLGNDYVRDKIICAERPDTPTKRDWDSAEFLRELARLEKGWGL